MAVRPEIKIIDGRIFKPGLREMLVGRSALEEFRGVAIGDEVALRDSRWTVVGVFESGGDANESSLMADAATLLSAYQRTAVNSVTVRLESEAAFDELKTALTTNPTLSVSVEREIGFLSARVGRGRPDLRLVGVAVGVFMGLGAIFAALNTMYSAVSARAREIATLRAIGFGAGGVVVSVLVEALYCRSSARCSAPRSRGCSSTATPSRSATASRRSSSRCRSRPALLGTGVLLACGVGLRRRACSRPCAPHACRSRRRLRAV